MKNKIFNSFAEAVADIPDGATIMLHAFAGPGGVPQNLIVALKEKGVKNLTVICCAMGVAGGTRLKPGFKNYITPTILIENHQVKKAITTWTTVSSTSKEPGEVSIVEQAILSGEVEWEPMSQGVLVERIRAGGAGLGPYYSPVGVGTILERGKEKRVFDGKEYLLEKPLRADFAFVRAYKADKIGNLIYKGTARSFNPIIATAANVTVAEVDEIVELGDIDYNTIVTPFVFVDRIVKVAEGGWK